MGKGTKANINQSGGSSVTIANTLYVAKNGNDATALPNRLDLPYLTVASATLSANSGDTVYVFAGVYSEGINDVTKSNVTLYTESGVTIQCSVQVISDFGQPKNIIIEGQGKFQVMATSFTFGVINLTNPASTIFFRGKDLLGITNGVNINNATSFDIKINDITVTLQYPINIRGNVSGTIIFGTISTLQSIAILCRNIGTDLVQRKIFINGERVISQTNSFAGGVVSAINTNNTKIYYSDFDIDHSVGASGGLFDMWSGFNYFRNISATSLLGYGFQTFNQGSTNLLFGCNIVSKRRAIYARFTAKIEAISCQFKADDDGGLDRGAIEIVNSAELDISNCLIEQTANSNIPSVINIANDNLIISNCKLIASTLITESIRSILAQNISVILQCTTNKPINANITNIVAGTNIIVDSNVRNNTSTFF